MANAPTAVQLPEVLPVAIAYLQSKLTQLRAGQVPLEKLLVTQKLSRELDQYKSPSPAARAVAQLQTVGKEVKVGQYVRFLYTRGEPGVYTERE